MYKSYFAGVAKPSEDFQTTQQQHCKTSPH